MASRRRTIGTSPAQALMLELLLPLSAPTPTRAAPGWRRAAALAALCLATAGPPAHAAPGLPSTNVAWQPAASDAEVVLVWEPAWGPHKMSDEARLELGML